MQIKRYQPREMTCTTWVSAAGQHPACLCPSLPRIQHLPRISTGRYFPLSKSSHTSATVLSIPRDHPTQSSHPLPPQSGEQALTAAVPALSLFLNRSPRPHSPPQPDFSRHRGMQQITFRILGTQAVSQSAVKFTQGRVSLHLCPPFPQIYFIITLLYIQWS